MKKQYIQPTAEVIALDEKETVICASVITNNVDKPGYDPNNDNDNIDKDYLTDDSDLDF